MKKCVLATLLYLLTNFAFAYGGLTHMFIADDVIKQLPNKNLRNILLDNHSAYLVGSYYPDSGYIKGTGYGEDSHWDEFIYAFADYIKENPNLLHNQKLIAFLFGCATHRVADETFHHHFLDYIAEHDSDHDHERAHNYGDLGIDLLINVDKHQWFNYPTHWWVPIKHLVQVYKGMHRPEYTANKIILGNSVIYFAGIGERLLTLTYPFWRYKMPWTAKHYMTWPECGVLAIEKEVVNYQMQLWNYIYNGGSKPKFAQRIIYHTVGGSASAIQVSENALQDKKLAVAANERNGEVEISSKNSIWQIREALKRMQNTND